MDAVIDITFLAAIELGCNKSTALICSSTFLHAGDRSSFGQPELSSDFPELGIMTDSNSLKVLQPTLSVVPACISFKISDIETWVASPSPVGAVQAMRATDHT